MVEFKIGISPCPNDTFIFRDLIHKRLELDSVVLSFDFADVQTLNERAEQGLYDMVKISFGQLPNVLNNYQLLPCGGAMGLNCGPLLVSNQESIDLKTQTPKVTLPGKNTTARHLFDFWAKNKGFEFNRSFGFFDDIYSKLLNKQIDNGVVIHESRFTYKKDDLNCLVDLGQFWEEETLSPIPLGGIVLHRAHIEKAPALIKLIRKSIENSQNEPSRDMDYYKRMAQISDEEVVKSHIELYVNEFSYDIGKKGVKAINVLLDHLDETNEIDRNDWLITE